jgi:hypothetical protein
MSAEGDSPLNERCVMLRWGVKTLNGFTPTARGRSARTKSCDAGRRATSERHGKGLHACPLARQNGPRRSRSATSVDVSAPQKRRSTHSSSVRATHLTLTLPRPLDVTRARASPASSFPRRKARNNCATGVVRARRQASREPPIRRDLARHWSARRMRIAVISRRTAWTGGARERRADRAIRDAADSGARADVAVAKSGTIGFIFDAAMLRASPVEPLNSRAQDN